MKAENVFPNFEKLVVLSTSGQSRVAFVGACPILNFWPWKKTHQAYIWISDATNNLREQSGDFSSTFRASHFLILFRNHLGQPSEVTKHTVASLRAAPVGDGHHGRDFYKFFFETHPEHRHFYKGAENYSGKDVLKSERFDKLGDAILLFVHVLANTYENESVFRAFVHRVMIEHFTRNIDPKLWKTFWEFWTGYLNSKGANLSAEQQTAWHELGTKFNEEAQSYLAKVGRDHA